MVAIPVVIPEKEFASDSVTPDTSDSSARATPIGDEATIVYPKCDNVTVRRNERKKRSELEVIEHASSRCMTPTFGSDMRLSSVQEALTRFGGGITRRSRGITKRSHHLSHSNLRYCSVEVGGKQRRPSHHHSP